MNVAKMLGVSTLAAAALALAVPTLASADTHYHRKPPHKVKVCKWERHHGHKTKVCHWVSRR